jgi:hypothetical protein
MALAAAGLILAMLTIYVVWRVVDRFWQILVIVALAIGLFPLVASWLAGDVSLFLPTWMFSQGADSKDQIVLASGTATVFVSLILAACIWKAALMGWRRFRTPPKGTHEA